MKTDVVNYAATVFRLIVANHTRRSAEKFDAAKQKHAVRSTKSGSNDSFGISKKNENYRFPNSFEFANEITFNSYRITKTRTYDLFINTREIRGARLFRKRPSQEESRDLYRSLIPNMSRS